MPLNLYIYLSVVASIFLIVFGLTIFLSDKRSKLNRLFFVFALAISAWLTSNYLSGSAEVSPGIALVSNHVTLFSGAISVLALAFFAKSLTSAKKNRWWTTLLASGLLSACLSLTPAVIKGIQVSGDTYEIDFGIFAPVYFATILASSVVAIYVLASSRKRLGVMDRMKVNVILQGFTITILGISITNIMLPFAFNNFTLTNFGSYFIIFLAIAIGYSVTKHRLFDLRFIVARLIGYAISFMVVGGVAFLALTALSGILGVVGLSPLAQRIAFVGVAFLLAILYQPFKRRFDKTTNKLFYQDAYEPQVFLDELNRVLVSTIDLNNLLKLSTEVIEQNLKAEFCVFGLKETDFAEQRIIGNTQRKFDYQDISYARAITPQMDHKVIVADHLDEPDKELRGKMRRNEVAVLARLTSDVDQEGIGYIVLGAKKSGNPYNSQDIRVLETIANAMVIAIDNALRFEEIQKFNITLEKRVEDATRRLQRANDKLIALDQTKDDFISMASHQLRTPLTSVKGYLSMVLEGDAGKLNAQQSKLLDQAFISSQRMVYLIADLLNVSRLRTGKFVIETAEVNLAEVVQGEVAQLVDTAAARNLKLSYKMPKSFPTLMLDETKIRQVIMNFIDNAIYYTPSGGKIDVSLLDDGKMVEFRVHDSGIGVPKSEQHNLFNKFFRAGNARKARPDGTGLGLFMAKKVVVAQGGAVVFESTEGKGSTFGFTFEKVKLAPGES